MQAGLLEFANDPYRLPRNGMQEREEALGQRKRFGQMLYAANERAPARADGPLGRRSGRWCGRWLWSRQRLRSVCAACSSSALALSDESVEWAICRSRRSFQRAESVLSGVPPVGRGSLGLMP
jgi:hypothetical protein